MAGILSKDTKLAYGTFVENTKAFTKTADIENMQEAPAIGGSRDQIDVTVLTDGAFKFIPGIKNYGDLQATFLYDSTATTGNYVILRGLEQAGSPVWFELTLPDDDTTPTKFWFEAYVNVELNAAAVNTALQFVCTFYLQSEIYCSLDS